MKFPETFLTKLRPIQAMRVTEIKESVISEEVLKEGNKWFSCRIRKLLP